MSPFKVTGMNVAFQPIGNSGWGGSSIWNVLAQGCMTVPSWVVLTNILTVKTGPGRGHILK